MKAIQQAESNILSRSSREDFLLRNKLALTCQKTQTSECYSFSGIFSPVSRLMVCKKGHTMEIDQNKPSSNSEDLHHKPCIGGASPKAYRRRVIELFAGLLKAYNRLTFNGHQNQFLIFHYLILYRQ